MPEIEPSETRLNAVLAFVYDSLVVSKTCERAVFRGVMPRPH